MDEIAVTVRYVGDTTTRPTVLAVMGTLTHSTAPSLRNQLRDAIDRTPRLVVDLSCCTDIDVDGLLALSVAQHAARTRGGDLRLVDVPPLIERQLRQHNFEELLADGD